MCKNILQHVFIYSRARRSRLLLSIESGELVQPTHAFLLELQECPEERADCRTKLSICCRHQQVTQDYS